MKKTIKKLSLMLTAIFILSACALILSSCDSGRSSKNIDGIYYYLSSDKKSYFAGGSKDGGDVVIPEEVNGKPVIGIAADKFTESSFYTSISVPDSIIYIGPGALAYSEDIEYNEYMGGYYLGNDENPYVILVKATGERFTVADGCRAICDNAFSNETEYLTISSTVKYISPDAFASAHWETIKNEDTGEEYYKGLKWVDVDSQNENYISIDNIMILNRDKTRLVLLIPSASAVIPSSVEFAERSALSMGYYKVFCGNYIPSENNKHFILVSSYSDNGKIADDCKIIAPYACSDGMIEYEIPAGVVEKMPNAFNGAKKVTSVGEMWFDNDYYLDGMAYDMAVGIGRGNKGVIYLKKGEYTEILTEEPMGTHCRRYID